MAITGTWQGTSRVKLYKELGFQSLSNRRAMHRLIQICKIVNNQTPSYLKDKLPPPRLRVLRNMDPKKIYPRATKTNRHEKNFYHNSIRLWNGIVGELEGDITVNQIKSFLLKRDCPKPRSFFGIHDPTGLHYLFQLRTGLSPLRSHKFHHHFNDTLSELCSCRHGSEDTHHFLFYCLPFATHRAKLAATVTCILARYNLFTLANEEDLYLYGDKLLTDDDNQLILLATIQYIKNTQRFEPSKR